MERKKIALKYTSLRCYRETDDGPFSWEDEPYVVFAAFHGDWYKVSYTHSYSGVDEGESRGANNKDGDVYLIASSNDRFYAPGDRRWSNQPIIYSFMLEADWGRKGQVVGWLKSELEQRLRRHKAGQAPWPPLLSNLTAVVKDACVAGAIDGDDLIQAQSWTVDLSKLGSNGYGRKTLTYRGEDGKYAVRFSVFCR